MSLGRPPVLTAYGLFAVKSGLILADGDETDAMRRGRHVEVLAAEFLREERPAWTIAPNTIPGGKFYRDMGRRVSCTPDIFAVDPDRDGFGVVQVKSVEPSIFRKQWRDDDGNVAPPLYVAVQTIQEAYLTGASWAVAAPVVIGHRIDMPIIDVPLHRPLLDRLHAEVAAFWRGVESGQPPDPDLNRDAALIEELYPPSGETVDLSADNLAMELVDERERLSAEQKGGKERLAEIKSELLLKLGGASAGRLADGRLVAVSKVNVKEHYVSASTQTRLTIKKARKVA